MRVTRYVRSLSAAVVVLVGTVSTVGCDGSNSSDGGDRPDAGLPPPIFVDAGPVPEPVDGGGDNVDAGPVNSSVYITGLSEAAGPQVGGNRVTIQGDGFDPSCSVRYGDVEADPELCILLTQRAFACQVPPGVEPGPVDVTIVCANGIGQLEDGYTYFSPIALTSIAPATGDVEGGTPITLTGASFTAGMVALIGQRHVVALDVADDGLTATALTPPGQNAARVDVVVIDTFGRATLPRAFAYTSALRLDSVEPAVASPGDVIDVFGAGFTENNGAVVSAAVDDVAADRDNLVSDRRQRVVVPAVAAGPQDVSVDRVVDAATVDARLGDALVVLGAATGTFTVSAVVPRFVDLGGGDVVTIAGEGFTTATAVSIDGTAATDVVVVDDRRLRARVPAHAAGSASVVVTRADASTASLPNALTYRQQLRVVDVEPASGAADGGVAVTVNGAGFVAGATVRFGGVPCVDVVVVDSSTITCTTAAGAPGLVDVRVTNADGTSVVAGDAFLFETPVSVVGIVPARGAFSGDVVVSVAGAGFERLQRLATPTNPLLVLIGGVPCDPRELVVVSDNLLTTRTPLTDIGTFDVTVGLATIVLDANGQPVITMSEDDASTKARAYTTYDPTSMLGGTRGGAIDGALYVTALDAFTGAPIPNALAFTGTDGRPTAADITHVFGQATLSGPDVVGAQTVTVAADGYETGTMVDVNARDITFLLQPIAGGGGGGGGTPQPPPLPAQVRGRVFGFAKEFFDPAALSPDEIALAIVVTSARDEFSSSGNGGAGSTNNVFTEGGEFYLANTRTGRLALVAVAGIYNLVTGEFRPRQLGIRNEVFP
ncbi:MAG TPA: IPT/TIG domain-containing protein, partial [Myxococcota bacterium]